MTDTWQWLRCDSAGGACVAVPGATSAPRPTWTSDDVGHRMKIDGWRDGVYIGRSAPTSVIRAIGSTDRPFSEASAVNVEIPGSPTVHADTALMLSATTHFLLAGGALDFAKEWLGPRQRTMYWKGDAYALATTPMYVNYIDFVGYACDTTPTAVPLPPGWATIAHDEASFDGISWIVDESTGDVWEGYRITPPGVSSKDIACSSARWNAVRYDKFLAEEDTGVGYGHGISASGSGMNVGAGLIRPEDFDDVSAGSVIQHALRINWGCGSSGANYPVYVSPATSGDGQQARGAPMGCRIQLDPAIDVDGWASVTAKTEPWRSALRKILRTLQVYGAIPVDSSGPGAGGLEACVAASVAPYVYPWQQAGYGWSYANGIPYDLMSHFRVIDWASFTGV